MAYSKNYSLFGTMRDILRRSQAMGCFSFTYHLVLAAKTGRYSRPRRLFSNAWANHSQPVSIAIRQHIEKVHDIVVEEGHSTSYGVLMGMERVLNSKTARQIENRVTAAGLTDELIIPVYGPFSTEGCMCFGLPKTVSSLSKVDRTDLEGMASRAHLHFMNGFKDFIREQEFSPSQKSIIALSGIGYRDDEIAENLEQDLAAVRAERIGVAQRIGARGKLPFALSGIVLDLLEVKTDGNLGLSQNLPRNITIQG